MAFEISLFLLLCNTTLENHSHTPTSFLQWDQELSEANQSPMAPSRSHHGSHGAWGHVHKGSLARDTWCYLYLSVRLSIPTHIHHLDLQTLSALSNI